MSLLRKRGRLGLIVPISLTSAQRMKSLQRKLLDESSAIYFSNFALRPAALFHGVMQRLTICLMCDGKTSSAFTTCFNSWYAEERTELFRLLNYTTLIDMVQEYSLPKLDSPIARTALSRITSIRHAERSQQDFRGIFTVFYHRPGSYWIKAFNYRPHYRSLTDPEKKHTTISQLHLPSRKFSSNLFMYPEQ